jgi:predicted  nucleic acid-binding Zn-ribbon protein
MEVTRDTASELNKLVRLQEVEMRLSELRNEVRVTPQRIAALERELERELRGVHSAESSIEEAAKTRRQLETEVEDARQKLAHYKDQLMSVKTNTEYQAMLHEISYVEKLIESKEDLILEEMLEADELEGVLRVATANLESRRKELDVKRKELETFVADSEVELEKLRQELDQIESEVSAEYLSRYRRIASARNGVAIACVVDQSCQGCHVRLRPQLLAEVKLNCQILLCENCSRILYYPPA